MATGRATGTGPQLCIRIWMPKRGWDDLVEEVLDVEHVEGASVKPRGPRSLIVQHNLDPESDDPDVIAKLEKLQENIDKIIPERDAKARRNRQRRRRHRDQYHNKPLPIRY